MAPPKTCSPDEVISLVRTGVIFDWRSWMRFLVLDPPIAILLKELTVEVPTNLPIDYRKRKLRDHAPPSSGSLLSGQDFRTLSLSKRSVSFPTSVQNYPAILLGFGRRKAIGNSTPTGQSCYSFLAGDVPRVCVHRCKSKMVILLPDGMGPFSQSRLSPFAEGSLKRSSLLKNPA